MVDNIPVEWFNLFIICIFDLKKCRLGSVTSICCNFYFCALQDDWLCFWCGRSYGRLEKAKSIESNLLTTTTTTAKKTWKKKSWCMWERRRKARVCVCVCTVRTTGHKFQHSRPLLVRPDTDAINPRVRRALFSSLKGFLILVLLLFPSVCVWLLLLLAAAHSSQQRLHTSRKEEPNI